MTISEKVLLSLTVPALIAALLLPSGGEALREEPGTALRESAPVCAGEIDLNTAEAEELCALPGVGETIAERIILWREENGGFRCLEDLRYVEGIGEKTMERIYEYITEE